MTLNPAIATSHAPSRVARACAGSVKAKKPLLV